MTSFSDNISEAMLRQITPGDILQLPPLPLNRADKYCRDTLGTAPYGIVVACTYTQDSIYMTLCNLQEASAEEGGEPNMLSGFPFKLGEKEMFIVGGALIQQKKEFGKLSELKTVGRLPKDLLNTLQNAYRATLRQSTTFVLSQDYKKAWQDGSADTHVVGSIIRTPWRNGAPDTFKRRPVVIVAMLGEGKICCPFLTKRPTNTVPPYTVPFMHDQKMRNISTNCVRTIATNGDERSELMSPAMFYATIRALSFYLGLTTLADTAIRPKKGPSADAATPRLASGD